MITPTVPSTAPVRDYRKPVRRAAPTCDYRAVLEAAGISLRDYQMDAVRAVWKAFQDGVRRTLMVLPTGGGKTVTFSALIVAGYLAGRRMLVLAHRKELIDQAAAMLRMLLGVDAVGIVRADQDECDAPVIVASVATIKNVERLARARDFNLIVVDEAHHSAAKSYQAVLEGLRAFDDDGPKVLGVTATPDRSDGQGLGDIFETIAYEVGILTLIEHGWLVDVRAKRIHLDVSLDCVKRHQSDFAAGALGDVLTRADAPHRIAESIVRFASDRVCLVFTPTVAMAKATTQAIINAGIRAEMVEGKTPEEERERIVSEVRDGTLQALVNCGCFTEGTDIPRVDCVVVARPTSSRALYQQMAGRGLRLHSGKTDCLILDLVGATKKHQLQSAASLFGEALEGGEIRSDETATEAITRQRSVQSTSPDGRLVAFDVSLFDQRPLHWTRSPDGLMVLAGFDKAYAVHVTARDRASLHLLTKDGYGYRASPMVQNLPIGEAIARAETNFRIASNARYASTAAAWRAQPATPGQLKMLKRLGYRRPRKRDGISTKGEASDYITAVFVERAIASHLANGSAVAA